MSYTTLLRRSSRVMPVREGRVSVRPSGAGDFVDIGYCRIESDDPAAITVKTAIGGRRVIGYDDRLEVSWLQSSVSEMAVIESLQEGLHDIKIWRKCEADEGAASEERTYAGYFLQVLPGLTRGKIKIIAERQLSVRQMAERMVLV